MSNSKSTVCVWSPVILQLIKAAEFRGIKFRWASPAEMSSTFGNGTMGIFSPVKKMIVIGKGMTLQETEETITHEVAHALWFLSLKGKKVKRSNLKKMPLKTGISHWWNLLKNYSTSKWKEERFAYHFESRPYEVLNLLNQL